jgi:hypothetical protein
MVAHDAHAGLLSADSWLLGARPLGRAGHARSVVST